MGSWNHTCMVSNLHITAGEPVAVFMLLKNKPTDTFCYTNSFYDVCPVPFYGKYNDYGAVEECHGFGLNLVVEALRGQLYKFGQGPNEYHDCEVDPETFDIEVLFEADHEGRLGVEDHNHFNGDDYDQHELEKKRLEKGLTESEQFELDRLASRMRKQDTFRQVTHVVVHKKILDHILKNWYIEEYVGDGKGTHGYENNYTHQYFQTIMDSMPEYIARMKKAFEEIDKDSTSVLRYYSLREVFDWRDTCHIGRIMGYFAGGSSTADTFGLIDVSSSVRAYAEAGDWEGLEKFASEVMVTHWLNSFLSLTRKHWTKQTGAGGQHQETVGYRVLCEATMSVINEEQAEADKEAAEHEVWLAEYNAKLAAEATSENGSVENQP